jgi:hypothetical protein
MVETPEALPEDGKGMSFSLAAVLNLALFKTNRGADIEYMDRLDCSHVRAVESLLRSTTPYRSTTPFKHNTFEAFPIRHFEDLQSQEWVLFRARFAESAADGKKGNVYHGVSSVLAEMADNVAYHAGLNSSGHCRGVAAYQITARTTAFSVADDGQGFLSSLRTNPQWSTLKSEEESLRAVLLRHATRRVRETAGGGFKVLYNKLVSFNGTVLVRSGDCRATIKNISKPTNTLVLRLTEHDPGAQVTVIIAKQGDPVEEPI